MRKLFDKILQTGIKLCLLTGVAFTFAACYAPNHNFRDWENEPEQHQQDQQKLEKQLTEYGNQEIH